MLLAKVPRESRCKRIFWRAKSATSLHLSELFFLFLANSATNLHLSELFTLADDSLHVLRMRSSRPFELGRILFGEAGVRIVHP